MEPVINVVLPVFAIILSGYIAGRAGVVSRSDACKAAASCASSSWDTWRTWRGAERRDASRTAWRLASLSPA